MSHVLVQDQGQPVSFTGTGIGWLGKGRSWFLPIFNTWETYLGAYLVAGTPTTARNQALSVCCSYINTCNTALQGIIIIPTL